ncbi:hypothetical protein SK128_024981, partial [Halocaridina rubra]
MCHTNDHCRSSFDDTKRKKQQLLMFLPPKSMTSTPDNLQPSTCEFLPPSKYHRSSNENIIDDPSGM